jgi:hypothetical protein
MSVATPASSVATPASGVATPAPAAAARSGLDGRLEQVRDGIVAGWAFDWSDPSRRVEVDVLVDGERVARTTADMPRPALAREGLGDGRHGFYVELPARLRDGGVHTIAAAFCASGDPVAVFTGFVVKVSPAAEEWAGTSFQALPAEEGSARTSPQALPAADAVNHPGARRRVLRLRPSIQAQFPRRAPAQGFGDGQDPETIMLAEQIPVRRCEPQHFSIQPGVSDPEGERRRRFEEHPADYLAERLLITRLPGGLVDTSSYVICPTERQLLADSIRHRLPLPEWGYTQVDSNLFAREAEIEEREERVVALGAQTNPNYSHWLVESVVRALLFAPFDDGSVMYLSPPLKDWQREALALAGVAPERILTLSAHKLVRFPEVFAVSRGITGLPWLIPGALSPLAALAGPYPGNALAAETQRKRTPDTQRKRTPDTQRKRTPDTQRKRTPDTGPRRLYVSRALIERRLTTNEAELVAMLEHHGFQTVHPQTLSVSDQIKLFAGAEAVIGSWGSGLTNLLFSPPGTLAIELQPEDVGYAGNAFVWNIASIRGQRYAQVVCPVADGMRELALGWRNMTVDVPEIDELLSRLLG